MLCQCWYCKMLPLLLVDCCYFYIFLLSLSLLAMLCQCWYCNIMLLVASWLLLSYYFLLLLSLLATLCQCWYCEMFAIAIGWLLLFYYLFTVTITTCYTPKPILQDIAVDDQLIVVLQKVWCHSHCLLCCANADTAEGCCHHCCKLIVVILLVFCCHCHHLLCFANADTARWCFWQPFGCYYIKYFLLMLSLLVTMLCQNWHHKPVDCCYLKA